MNTIINYCESNGFEYKIEETAYTYSVRIGYYQEYNECLGYMTDEYSVAYFSISKVKNSLDMLKVTPEFQGKGLANQLMALVKELGIDNLMAESYGGGLSQENLIAFYEKHGFKQVVTNGNSTYMTLA